MKLDPESILKRDWFIFRDSLYEPKFVETFNDFFTNKVKIKVGVNKEVKYTILINTIFVYPGYNVGVWWEDSKLRATITVYETENSDKIEFVSKENYVRGKATYHSGNRMAAFLRKKTF